jgi:hypothetical protein
MGQILIGKGERPVLDETALTDCIGKLSRAKPGIVIVPGR